jgi:hypothetical protein
MIYVCIWITKYFLRAGRQIARLEARTRAPIISNLSETLRGVFYIKNCEDHNKVFQK